MTRLFLMISLLSISALAQAKTCYPEYPKFMFQSAHSSARKLAIVTGNPVETIVKPGEDVKFRYQGAHLSVAQLSLLSKTAVNMFEQGKSQQEIKADFTFNSMGFSPTQTSLSGLKGRWFVLTDSPAGTRLQIRTADGSVVPAGNFHKTMIKTMYTMGKGLEAVTAKQGNQCLLEAGVSNEKAAVPKGGEAQAAQESCYNNFAEHEFHQALAKARAFSSLTKTPVTTKINSKGETRFSMYGLEFSV